MRLEACFRTSWRSERYSHSTTTFCTEPIPSTTTSKYHNQYRPQLQPPNTTINTDLNYNLRIPPTHPTSTTTSDYHHYSHNHYHYHYHYRYSPKQPLPLLTQPLPLPLPLITQPRPLHHYNRDHSYSIINDHYQLSRINQSQPINPTHSINSSTPTFASRCTHNSSYRLLNLPFGQRHQSLHLPCSHVDLSPFLF